MRVYSRLLTQLINGRKSRCNQGSDSAGIQVLKHPNNFYYGC